MTIRPLAFVLAVMASMVLAPILLRHAWHDLPTDLSASIAPAELFAAGDSVRYVGNFSVPITSPGIDSVVVKWALGGNPNQTHVWRPPYPATVRDTVRFGSPPLTAGGSSATGSATIQAWRLGAGSPGLSKPYTINRSGPTVPPDVVGFVFADSAVVFP